jgi:hypothetical protein
LTFQEDQEKIGAHTAQTFVTIIKLPRQRYYTLPTFQFPNHNYPNYALHSVPDDTSQDQVKDNDNQAIPDHET